MKAHACVGQVSSSVVASGFGRAVAPLNPRAKTSLLWALALVLAMPACGDVVREGRSPVSLVVDKLEAAPSGGFGKDIFTTVLFSDVIVNVTSPSPCTTEAPCPTVYSDVGRATVHLEPKDVSVAPTSNNQVTIRRIHIAYRRADGRNTPGVDVPYGVDEAVTVTVPPSGLQTVTFEMVRHVAKEEPPLVQLQRNPSIINTIADVTLYGADLVGNEIVATGSLSIEFGNFGDQ